jgi:hypothetical protein
MDKKLIFKIVGIVLGVIGALALVSQHPILIVTMALGAAIWFAGDKLVK